MSKQPKSAKDLAFDRERTKLKSQIVDLESRNAVLSADNKIQAETIADLKSLIRFYQSELEKATGIDKETYMKDVETRQKIGSFLNLLGGVYNEH